MPHGGWVRWQPSAVHCWRSTFILGVTKLTLVSQPQPSGGATVSHCRAAQNGQHTLALLVSKTYSASSAAQVDARHALGVATETPAACASHSLQ